eukprot:CAMPEP_0176410984 /NCGR_PEP_ID=MMETSP0127-20121128/3354_1 /TAXON_ID=938130 /ORGANISM="Platyophrya macrostoma, Strain WH" /LENGTH=498 /DNA_ID=CAMNT_0017790529 /DNA_START=142 /DNA_END=1638 /DNA_ORIENTATION=+
MAVVENSDALQYLRDTNSLRVRALRDVPMMLGGSVNAEDVPKSLVDYNGGNVGGGDGTSTRKYSLATASLVPLGSQPGGLSVPPASFLSAAAGGATKKPKHRRPLGKSTDIRSVSDSSSGRVGYVCVADEFMLEELESHYADLGYYTKLDYDVLHIRFSEKELAAQQQQLSTATKPIPSSSTTSGTYGATDATSASRGTGGAPGTSASLQRATATSASVSAVQSAAANATRKVGFDLFVFQYGAIVWWGFDQKFFKIVEQDFMFPSSKIQKYIVNRYKTQTINEIYPVWCTYSLERKETLEPDDAFKDRLLFDHFLIPFHGSSGSTSTTAARGGGEFDSACISMLCASHALAQSAKIDYLEIKIQDLTQSCKPLPRELKEFGRVTITERRLLQLRGEVLSYRLMLKSGSDLLDEPELFWQNAYLKPIFQATKECFEIVERVKALDTKLDADHEILAMITDQFHERHGARLEWIVIWLVLVEVIIGVLELLLDVRPWVT